MKRNWKLIYYSILSSRPIISQKILISHFRRVAILIIHSWRVASIFSEAKEKKVSIIPTIRLSLKLYQIEFPIMYLFIYFVVPWLHCKRNFSIRFDSIIEHNTHLHSQCPPGTNLSRTFTNVSKILSSITANILNINTYLIERGYTSTCWPLTVLILLKITV